jgi:hypothetical protein
MGPLHALLLLAWALVRSIAGSLFGRRRGIEAFRASYAGDGLVPLDAAERDQMRRFGGCIACGLCDAGEGAAIVRSAGTYRGTMDLMLASSRNMPDYDAAARSFAAVGQDRLAELEGRCPARVPMRAIAVFVRTKAGQMVRAPGPKR